MGPGKKLPVAVQAAAKVAGHMDVLVSRLLLLGASKLCTGKSSAWSSMPALARRQLPCHVPA